ncbi:MAG: hypothetical protein Tsb0013_06300 [Phycisphaerales bacterium]
MSDRGAPHLAGVLALGAIAWIVGYWLWPTPSPENPATSITKTPSQSGPGTESDGVSDPVKPVDLQTGVETTTPDWVTAVDPDDAQPEVTETTPPGVEPPTYRIHIVAPGGETLQQISKRYFGTFDEWRAIARMNGHSVDPNRLTPGTEVKVPLDPDNVQGTPVDPDGDTPDPEPETQYTEYIVSRNDSLWTIARALYGEGTKWTVIRDANREIVGDQGERLRPGMVLKIPPPPGD